MFSPNCQSFFYINMKLKNRPKTGKNRPKTGYILKNKNKNNLVETDGNTQFFFRKVSVTKKPEGNENISPLHMAAINPNPKYLRDLLQVLFSQQNYIKTIHMQRILHTNSCVVVR